MVSSKNHFPVFGLQLHRSINEIPFLSTDPLMYGSASSTVFHLTRCSGARAKNHWFRVLWRLSLDFIIFAVFRYVPNLLSWMSGPSLMTLTFPRKIRKLPFGPANFSAVLVLSKTWRGWISSVSVRPQDIAALRGTSPPAWNEASTFCKSSLFAKALMSLMKW